jgi:hypothetical protein
MARALVAYVRTHRRLLPAAARAQMVVRMARALVA